MEDEKPKDDGTRSPEDKEHALAMLKNIDVAISVLKQFVPDWVSIGLVFIDRTSGFATLATTDGLGPAEVMGCLQNALDHGTIEKVEGCSDAEAIERVVATAASAKSPM